MKTLTEFLIESAQEFVGIHYSNKPNLTTLYGSMYGTGIKGAEAKRLSETSDSRIKKRVYFYPKTSEALPKPEQGLGVHAHEMRSDKLYDASKGDANTASINALKSRLVASGEHPANAFETAVLDHGYHGYHIPSMAVVLGRDVPVKYVGTTQGKTFQNTFNQTTSSKSISDKLPNASGEVESELLTPEQTSHVVRHRDSLKAIAPSFRQQYGRVVVHKSDVQSVKSHFQTAGLNI